MSPAARKFGLEPFYWNSWYSSSPPSQPQSLLVFTARSYGDFSSIHGNPGFLVWGWGPLLLTGDLHSQDVPPYFYQPHLGVGPVHPVPLPLLPASMWLLLYILSHRTSVQTDSRQFSLWLFYSLVVILKWSWEEVSPAFTYFSILTRSPRGCF